ncbi:MAG: 5'-nucleotidase C-terminal domain-containing protein [Rhodospirillales bacterium]|nr:5'-nucleotidase C-terminal domain-containing protein [Rhodospirillales bacterium]
MTNFRPLRFLAAAALTALLASCAATPPPPLRLTILHSNDVHSRLQPVNAQGSNCSAQDAAQNRCFGGIARIAALFEQHRREALAAGRQVLVLNAGDEFQGSLFYSHYKGMAELETANLIGYDAMAIGNHEFDDGPANLERYLNGAKFPVLSANVDASDEPTIRGKFRDHIVVERGGVKIGIIGATTEDTPEISSPGSRLKFVQAEAVLPGIIARLRAQGVTHVVVLGHMGLSRDRQLAEKIDGIDVIVGGHSHTLLGNGIQGAEGPYPVNVKGPSGRDVPIVQAGSFSRHIGRVDVDFDAAGNVVSATGNTIPVLQSVVPNAAVQAVVDRLDAPLVQVRNTPVGAGAATFSLDGCRARECALGNLVAEAMLAATRASGTTIAVQNGGGLRAGINEGQITLGNVLTTLPFQNNIATLKLRGRDLVAALENGLSQVAENGGRFPQIAGARLTWSLSRPVGSRVISLEVRRPDGSFLPIDPDALYSIATNDFMRRGGDGYVVFRDRAVDPYDFGPGLDDALASYIRANSPVRMATDGRIVNR